MYAEALGAVPNLKLLKTDPRDFIVPHILPVRILNGLKALVQEKMARANIPLGMHYKPNHLLSLFGKGEQHLPNAEKLHEELVTLPLHPGLTDEDVRLVCDTLIKILQDDGHE